MNKKKTQEFLRNIWKNCRRIIPAVIRGSITARAACNSYMAEFGHIRVTCACLEHVCYCWNEICWRFSKVIIWKIYGGISVESLRVNSKAAHRWFSKIIPRKFLQTPLRLFLRTFHSLNNFRRNPCTKFGYNPFKVFKTTVGNFSKRIP